MNIRRAADVQISNVTLEAQGGNVDIIDNVGNITLNGGVGTTTTLTTTGANGDVNIVAFTSANNENLTINSEGSADLQGTGNLNGGNLTITIDDDDNSTESVDIDQTLSNINQLTILASDTDQDDTITISNTVTTTDFILVANADTVDIDQDVTAGTTLTISNVDTSVDLAGNVDLTASDGNLTIGTAADPVANLNFSGNTPTTNNLVAGNITQGNGAVNIAANATSSSPDAVNITGNTGASLADFTLGDNTVLTIDFDADAGGGETLTVGNISTGQLAVFGRGAGDDTMNFNGSITTPAAPVASASGNVSITNGLIANFASTITTGNGTTGNVLINSIATVDLDGNVDSARAVTITNAATEIDLADGVDILARNGNVDMATGVPAIDLSSNGGDNSITARTGDNEIDLAAVTSSAGPTNLTVNSDGAITTSTIDLNGGNLTMTIDRNDDQNVSFITLAVNGQFSNIDDLILSGGASGNQDLIDINADITTTGFIRIQNADEADLALNVDLLAGTSVEADTATNNLALIDLSSAAGGTNRISAGGGNLDLAPISDSSTGVDLLDIDATGTATLNTITLNGNVGINDIDILAGAINFGGTVIAQGGDITGNATAGNIDNTSGGAITINSTGAAGGAENGGNIDLDANAAGATIGVSNTINLTADGGGSPQPQYPAPMAAS